MLKRGYGMILQLHAHGLIIDTFFNVGKKLVSYEPYTWLRECKLPGVDCIPIR